MASVPAIPVDEAVAALSTFSLEVCPLFRFAYKCVEIVEYY